MVTAVPARLILSKGASGFGVIVTGVLTLLFGFKSVVVVLTVTVFEKVPSTLPLNTTLKEEAAPLAIVSRLQLRMLFDCTQAAPPGV